MLLNISIDKILIEMSKWAFRVFSDPGFHFGFQFFRIVDMKENPERCLNTLTLTLSCMWAWSMAIFGVFLADLFSLLGVKMTQRHQKKTSNWPFCLSRGDLIEIAVFSQSLNTYVKKRFSSVSSIKFSVFLLHFPSKLLR